MTRDETIALFLECEAKRAEALTAALAEGKEEREVDELAHEAAKAHWNAWAKCHAREAEGTRKVRRRRVREKRLD